MTPLHLPPSPTRRLLVAAALALGLAALPAACGDDDGEQTPTPSTGETGVDGSEADAGDPSDDTVTDEGGGATGGGTEGNQELDTPQEQGGTEDTARGGAG